MKKIKIKIYITIVILLLISVISYFFRDNLTTYIDRNKITNEIKEMKFIDEKDKDKVLKNIKKSNNIINEYRVLKSENDKYASFEKNSNILINPSSVKSVKNYKPNLVDLAVNNPNLVSTSAIKNNEASVAKVVYNSLIKMINDAKKENIDLYVNSAYRSFNQQKSVKALSPTLAADPGESEHQTGLAIDFGQRSYDYFGLSPAFNWMSKHAYKYGYILSFPKNLSKLSGENYEQWHWRYIGKRYALMYKKELDKNKSFTYADFITKYFGYKYVSQKIYNAISDIIKINSIENILELQGKDFQIFKGKSIINSPIIPILKLLKTAKNNLNTNLGDYIDINSNEININYLNALAVKLGGYETLSRTINVSNLNNVINNKEIFKSDLQHVNKNESKFTNSFRNYHVGERGSFTFYDKKRLISVLFLKSKTLILSRKVINLNTHEFLKQRDFIYQIVSLEK